MKVFGLKMKTGKRGSALMGKNMDMHDTSADVIAKMDRVFSWLEDEESRFIFQKRRQFNESGNYRYIDEIIDKYVPEMKEYKWCPDIAGDFITQIKKMGKKVIIWGAGYNGRILLQMCVERGGVKVDFFCDNNQEKQHTEIDGVPVISPEELKALQITGSHIIVVSPITTKYRNEINSMIIELGMQESDIYMWADYYYPRELNEKQYFDEVISLKEDEVFIDGGCCDFTNSRCFLDRMRAEGLSCRKLYAFEPDEMNCRKCQEWVDTLGIDCAEIINAGLWSDDTCLSFEALGNGSSHFSQFSSLGDNEACLKNEDLRVEQVKVVSLDSYIKEGVSFIKLDIEGAELEALKGARNILLKYKPKLAVCIYHKKEDLYEIPYYLKTLNPEYKLYIRHYSNFAHETVLYAV